MEVHKRLLAWDAESPPSEEMELEELRRGPWTVEEDIVLVEHVTEHGEGRWNALALRAGTYLDQPICVRVVLIEL